jgi:caffeoyl-CoA O-methyltransferase
MNLNQGILEDYLEQSSTPCPGYLKALERETHLKISKPQMLTGFVQGRLLAFLARLSGSRRILEVGTFTGYGSLCLCEGLTAEGRLTTLDNSEENTWLARKYFALSPYERQIELKIGPALETIPELKETWDLVYLDADKNNNPKYLDLVWPNLRQGGLVLIDNVFAHGGVWKPADEMKMFEKTMADFNRQLPFWKPNAKILMLPIRDGLTVIQKI